MPDNMRPKLDGIYLEKLEGIAGRHILKDIFP